VAVKPQEHLSLCRSTTRVSWTSPAAHNSNAGLRTVRPVCDRLYAHLLLWSVAPRRLKGRRTCRVGTQAESNDVASAENAQGSDPHRRGAVQQHGTPVTGYGPINVRSASRDVSHPPQTRSGCPSPPLCSACYAAANVLFSHVCLLLRSDISRHKRLTPRGTVCRRSSGVVQCQWCFTAVRPNEELRESPVTHWHMTSNVQRAVQLVDSGFA